MSQANTAPAIAPSPNILWFDAEFTGLSARDDLMLQVAALATTYGLGELASYERFIAHPLPAVEARMSQDNWWNDRRGHRDFMLNGISNRGVPLPEVERQLMGFAEEHCGTQNVILAGNTIRKDREFIDEQMPRFGEMLHKRMIDVSSFKVLVQGLFGVEYVKQQTHQAEDDVRESVEELRFILDLMGNNVVRAALSAGG